MNKEISKVELFNRLKSETDTLKDVSLEIQNMIESKTSSMDKLIKEMFEESNDLLKKCVINWVLANPIETVTYCLAKERNAKTIYYKNDDKYTELFESDNFNEEAYYSLINKNTLESIIVSVKDVCNHYSTMSYNSSLSLDFLNNYKINLIKEVGYFCDDNNWSIEYEILNSKSYSNSVYKVIRDNFAVNELELKDYRIKLSRENIESLIDQYTDELELGYKSDKSFAIYNDSDIIGFIQLNSDEYFEFLDIDSFEIFEKYRGLGYGSEVIDYLKSIYGIIVSGYSVPEDKVINFWHINGAEFDSCENCEENGSCNRSECDEPLDYCFTIPRNYI